MKNIPVSKQNWKELKRLRDEIGVNHFNDVVTRLLQGDIKESVDNEVDDKYNIQSASCSECHYEFDFVVDQRDMFLCCPKCGKTKKIKIE